MYTVHCSNLSCGFKPQPVQAFCQCLAAHPNCHVVNIQVEHTMQVMVEQTMQSFEAMCYLLTSASDTLSVWVIRTRDVTIKNVAPYQLQCVVADIHLTLIA